MKLSWREIMISQKLKASWTKHNNKQLGDIDSYSVCCNKAMTIAPANLTIVTSKFGMSGARYDYKNYRRRFIILLLIASVHG